MREYDYRQKWTKLLTPERTTPVSCEVVSLYIMKVMRGIVSMIQKPKRMQVSEIFL